MTSVRRNGATLLAVFVCLALALAACRTGVPVIDDVDRRIGTRRGPAATRIYQPLLPTGAPIA